MMSCAEITELVTTFLDKRMPLRQRLAFRMDIAMCTHCRRYLRQVTTTVRMTGRLPVEPMPSEVRDELVRALLAMAQREHDRDKA